MARAANITFAARAQSVHAISDLAPDIFHCSPRQSKLIVHPTMKDDARAKIALEPLQLHPRTRMLNRIQYIHATIEDRPQQAARRAIGVVKDTQTMRVNQIAPALEPRL